MPELNLDSAFESLTTEVGERTASRGAAAAISDARRRRTTIGAAAAVALIAVGGVVFSQLGGDSDRLSPVGEVPPPAVLDAAALNSITEGWVSGWHEAGKGDQAVLEQADAMFACLDNGDASTEADLEPSRFGNQIMVGDSGAFAYLIYGDFGDQATAANAATEDITSTFATCAGNSGVTDSYGNDATVTSYDLPVDGATSTETAWVARLGNKVSFSMVWADGRQTATQRGALGAALLGALQVDASYRSDSLGSGGSASASSAPSSVASYVAHPAFNDVLLAGALGGWSTWAAHGAPTSGSLPCLGGPATSSAGSGESVGSTAELTHYDFESAADARQGESDVIAQLAACDSGPWTIDSTTVPGAVVASHSDGVAWIAQQGSTLVIFTLTDATDPPRSVKLAVGKLVIDAAG